MEGFVFENMYLFGLKSSGSMLPSVQHFLCADQGDESGTLNEIYAIN